MSKPNKKKVALEDLRKNRAELRASMLYTPRETQWWERPVVEYAFSHPHVRSRLEKLMGSNIVRVTDRDYMLRLQERIMEDHLETQDKRMNKRASDELDRVKKLILEGKLPLESASKELMEHPVFKITMLTRKIIEEKRAKMRVMPPIIAPFYYGSADEEGEVGAGEAAAVLGISAGRQGSSTAVAVDECFLEFDDVSQGFMFSKEDYEKLKYEAPLVKTLRELETVDELYAIADEIIGPLKTMKPGQHCSKLT